MKLRHISEDQEKEPHWPHWEHGYRCHGYWLNDKRIGFIGIPPLGTKPIDYGWFFELGDRPSGRSFTLRKAKTIIENLWKQISNK